MRRITDEEIAFYDRLAERIGVLLAHPQCPLTQSSLADRISWNRASLCNFINRIDKSIAAHFVPRIAVALQVPVEQLMIGKPSTHMERTSWDPRLDEPQVMLDKLADWDRRNLPWDSLHRILPAWVMPNRAMMVNYVDSIFSGANPVAAERWHEFARSRHESFGDGDGLHIMFLRDLMRIPQRTAPYDIFSMEEIACLLEHLKVEWIEHRNFRLIAAPDSAWTADLRLEMAGNRSLTAIGREVRIEFRDNCRVHWSEDANSVVLARECLGRLKKSAGMRLRDKPSPRDGALVIDQLLSRLNGDNFTEQVERRSMRLNVPQPSSTYAPISDASGQRVIRRSQCVAAPIFR